MPGRREAKVRRSELRAQQRAAAVAGGVPDTLEDPPAPLPPSVAVPL
jgi:hypothetical protein